MQEFIEKIIIEAGALAMVYYEKGVTSSVKTGHHDLLTVADTAVSTFLVDKIHAAYPDHHIYSEEMATDINPGAEYEWVIDPIDGTWNFANHIPTWGILIAVVERGVTKYAATYWPVDNHLYTAEKGKGAFLNGEPIRVSNVSDLALSAGNVFSKSTRPHAEALAVLTSKLYLMDARIKNYSCMYNAMLLARGVLDFYASNGGFDYDHLAPILICEEAGAIVTDSYGNPWHRNVYNMVIGNPHIHPKIISLLQT